MNSHPNEPTAPAGNSPLRKWLAKLGIAGFMFFFLKGLVWLAIFFGVGKCVI
jgi:hypothetical protein